MDKDDKANELYEAVYSQLTEELPRIADRLSPDPIHAVCIYCASSFDSIGLAVSTVQGLENGRRSKPDLDPNKQEMLAAEWTNLGDNGVDFAAATEFTWGLWDGFYEAEMNEPQILDFFQSVFLRVLHDLKNSGVLNHPNITNDPFISLQFGDPSWEEIDMSRSISAEVNSESTHEKFNMVLPVRDREDLAQP